MSSNLYWAPPPSEINDHYIDLKYEIGRYLYDGEYNGQSIESELSIEDIPFLKGIVVAGSDGQASAAKELIQAIEKYRRIEIFTRS